MSDEFSSRLQDAEDAPDILSVTVWRRSLSVADIAALHNGELPKKTIFARVGRWLRRVFRLRAPLDNLIAFWPLNEVSQEEEDTHD